MTAFDLVEAMAQAIWTTLKDSDREANSDDVAEQMAQAAIKAIEGTGWKLVPVEPTEHMAYVAAVDGELKQRSPIESAKANYRAALAAAPNPLEDKA